MVSQWSSVSNTICSATALLLSQGRPQLFLSKGRRNVDHVRQQWPGGFELSSIACLLFGQESWNSVGHSFTSPSSQTHYYTHVGFILSVVGSLIQDKVASDSGIQERGAHVSMADTWYHATTALLERTPSISSISSSSSSLPNGTSNLGSPDTTTDASCQTLRATTTATLCFQASQDPYSNTTSHSFHDAIYHCDWHKCCCGFYYRSQLE
mmetsp:Transcript_41505/g.99960  ORF Transcript_41505/g.99960 Transcript_41505/m.99960 type:complete len:210 (+) Transcript_41505:465-1094(+)